MQIPKERNFTLRFGYLNEQHRRILKVLDDLNPDIYKSKTQFIMDAIDYYVTSLESDDFTTAGARKRKQQEKEYVTHEQLVDIKNDIRQEIYEDIIKLLGNGMVAASVGNTTMPANNYDKSEITGDVSDDESFDVLPEVEEACMKWS